MFKRKIKFLLPLLVITTILFGEGCDDTLTSADVDNRIIPDSNVKFSKDIAPIFGLHCNNCHGYGRYEGSLDLTDPSRFVDGRIVVSGISETSILVWRIDPKYGTDPMPPIDSPFKPLTAMQIRGVKTWIDEGAINN